MYTKTVALSALAIAGSAMADLLIQTPASLIQCQPVLLSWSGGQAPYYLAAIPGGQPSAPAIKDFGEQSGNTYTWTVDIPAGQSVTLKVTDSTGIINYDQAVTIQEGSVSSCLTSGTTAASSAMSSMAVAASSMSGMSSSMMSMSSSMPMISSSMSTSMSMSISASASKAMSTSGMSSASGMSSMSSAKASTSGSSAMSSTTVKDAAAVASATSSGAAFTSYDVSTGLLAMAVGAFGATWF